MKFIKTNLVAVGFALATCFNVAASDTAVNIKLSDAASAKGSQDVVKYLSSYKDELAEYLPDGHSIEINIVNIEIPDDIDRTPKHKTTTLPLVNDGISQNFSTNGRNLDIPGGKLSRLHRLQFEYAVVDADGNNVVQGKKNLKIDSMKASNRAEQPYIEQRSMLTNWMKRTFSEQS
ncbi:hypothetical protein [Brumicola blandensis]|uniref:DUF3016 domain-containing protein n=1 Tax=Brumicola blandensis TaxID=3075611 RepID=A0AAW8R7V8_9ALTE|nr:hypothetical protein [Alteromonas sp. W409]MDT0583973.1 hypothetical protein [Alteromonas sp. W409]